MSNYEEELVVTGRSSDQVSDTLTNYTVRLGRPATPVQGVSMVPIATYSFSTTDQALYDSFPYGKAVTMTLTPAA